MKNKLFLRVLSILICTSMFFSLSIVAMADPQDSSAVVARLQTNNLFNPVGTDIQEPVFSWIMQDDTRGQKQTAYQIIVASSEELLNDSAADVWNTGRVEGDRSNNIKFDGISLQSKTRYYWSVRVWDKDGNPSEWGETAFFETSLFNLSEWTAKWISAESAEEVLDSVTIALDQPVTARYLMLNVSKVGPAVLERTWFRLQLAEIEAYGPDSADNIAMGCSVSSNNTLTSGPWSPNNLTDGIRKSAGNSMGYTSNQYDYTDNPEHIVEPPITLTIDLGSERTVDRLVFYPRTDVPSKDDATVAGSFPKDFEILTKGETGDFSIAKTVTDCRIPSLQVAAKQIIPMFGKSFTLDKPVKKARAYVSGLGLYEMTINGRNVTDNVFEPGESAYEKTVFYKTYDITSLLRDGENAVGAMIGKGQYSVPSTPGRYQKLNNEYGPLQFIAQIEVTYQDGTTTVINTDESWKSESSPIIFLDWYGGEDHDANLEIAGWDEPGFDYSGWKNAKISEAQVGKLTAHKYPSTKVVEEWEAVAVTNPAEDIYVVDFGRNFAGIFEMSMSAPKDTKVEFWPSEVLNGNGRADQASSGSPIWDSYIFKGEGTETWMPKFVYHGFRYLEVRGLSSAPTPDMFTAKLIRSDNEIVGSFETSSYVLNQISLIINRAVESNMYNTMTDCPHREKLGWLEVPHLLYNSVSPNYDVAAWMKKINDDIIDTQYASGLVTTTAPEFGKFSGGFKDEPTWAAALVMIPWQSYLTYGDMSQLEKAYPAMLRWMAYLDTQSNGYLLNYGLGDWGSYDTSTSLGFTVTSTYYHMANIMAQIAQLLGQEADIAKFEALRDNIYTAINNKYYNVESKSYDSGSQAANAMALYYDFVPEDDRAAVLDNLVNAVEKAGNHLTTGEVALRPLFMSLAQNGMNDTVYAMATNRTMPSYWYFIENDRTTLPEFWDMAASQNHCMMGHIEGWFYEYLGGIRNDGIAYKNFIIDPYIPGDLDYTDISTTAAYGTITSAWKSNGDGTITLKAVVPANSTATIYLPSARMAEITEDGQALSDRIAGILSAGVENKKTKVEVESGTYLFTFPAAANKSRLIQSISDASGNVESNVLSGWDALEAALEAGRNLLQDADPDQKDIDTAQEAIDNAALSLVLDNIALLKTPIASSSFETLTAKEKWSLAHLVDGDRIHPADGGLQNGSGGYSSSPKNYDHIEWAGVDFRYAYTFNQVTIYPRNLTAYGLLSESIPEDFEIQVSNDGENWETVHEEKAYPTPPDYNPIIFTFDAVTARYVRIYATKLRPLSFDKGNYYIQFAELEVYYHASVNKSALEALISQAGLLDQEDYTIDTWADFAAALAGAEEVFGNEDADQDMVNSAYADLATAMNALEKVGSEEIPVIKIKINASGLFTLSIKKKAQIPVTIEPDDASDRTVQWISTNTNIFTVDDEGNITPKKQGTATLTAQSSNGLKSTIIVRITA